MPAVLPTAAEVIGAVQTKAQQKVDLADLHIYLAERTNAFTTAGTLTAYTGTPVPSVTAYFAGLSFFVTFHVASGAAPTLAISGIGTPPQLVKQNVDGTYSNIAAGDIPVNHRSRVTLLSATQALVERLPVSAGGPAFSAYANANQSLTSSVLTKVAFQAELYDSTSSFDSTTNFRWTPGVPGYYRLQTNVRGTAVSGMTSMAVVIYKNGVEYSRGAEANNATSLVLAALPAQDEIFLNATDFVEIYVVVQGTTPSLQFSTATNTSRFSGSFVRGA